MEQDSEHEEIDKRQEEAGVPALDRALSLAERDQGLSESPRQPITTSSLPALHFTLLDEDNTGDNGTMSEHYPSPHSDSAAHRRHQLCPSDSFGLHSVSLDQRRHSVHSKPSLSTLLDPGSAAGPGRQSESSRRRSSISGPPPDPNMDDPLVMYPLSFTRSRNPIVGSRRGSSPGYGGFVPQEQPGFFDLASSRSHNKRTKSPQSTSEARNPQKLPGLTNPSIASNVRPHSLSTESMNSTNSVPFAPPPPPTPSLWRNFRNQLSNRVLKRQLRFMAALYLSALMTLIRPIANYLGPMPFLAGITVVFMHPARTVGSQLEVTLFSVIGAIIATAWIIPSQVSVAAYNQQFFAKNGTLDGSVSWVIEATWFFVGIWIMTTLKARYAKLTYTFLIFAISNINCYSKSNDNLKFSIHPFWASIGPMMIGVGISLLTNVVLWPETASEGLGRALNESLDTSRALLNLSTRSFLLNHKTIVLPKSIIENAQKEVRNAQKKLFAAYREARYEVTYATYNPADYKEVRVVVSALMRHLGSMSLVVQNERLLMLGHPDRENDDLETESGDEQSLASSGGGGSDRGDSDDGRDTDTESSSEVGSTGGSGRGGTGLKKHKRGSAAELRRIRQLLMRAEKSTTTVLQAHRTQEDDEARKSEERSKSLEDNVRGSTAPPSMPEGGGSRSGDKRSSSAFKRVSGSRLSTDSVHNSSLPDQMPITAPIIRSSVSSPHLGGAQGSGHPSSLDGDHIDRMLKGSKDLLRGVSTKAFKSNRSPPHRKSSRTSENHQQKRTRSGSIDRPRSSVGAGRSSISGSSRPLPGAEGSGVQEDSGAGVGSSVGGFLEERPSHHNISGSMSEYQVNKAAEVFAAKKKGMKGSYKQAEQKLPRKQDREDDATKNVPPKEVAFGDRKLFLLFLDTVREPLERLSDACSRSMATMERELAMELGVENDRMERIRRRNADRDAIVRRAAAAAEGHPRSLKKGELPIISDPHPSAQDVSNNIAYSEPPVSILQRIATKIGISPHLTKGEMDFMHVFRSTSYKEKRHMLSKSGIPADGTRPRNLQQATAAALSGSAVDENESDSSLPGDMSYVQYLTQELETFDQAEADGLREFIARHPTLDVGPREEIFLIFFFIFALREIARELLRLGAHLEEMKRKQEVQMELSGRKKPRKRLWWPKVIGNFERWFSWGSYSQTRASEGYSGTVMRPTKNFERRQPRLFAEEKAHVAAKAAKAAEQEAKQMAAENARREKLERRDQMRRRRNTEACDARRPRRSVTMSAIFPRALRRTEDLEAARVDSTRFAPHTGMSNPLASYIKRTRSFFTSNGRTSDRSTPTRQPDVPLYPLSLDLNGGGAPEVLDSQSGAIAGRDGPSQKGPYAVVDIPDFQSLHPDLSTDNNYRNTHSTSVVSPKVNTTQPRFSAPLEVRSLNEAPQPTSISWTAASTSRSENQAAEPHPSSQHRPRHLPVVNVTYTDQSDDGGDSEDRSVEEEVAMGYERQPSRKRSQSAFADFSPEHPKDKSSQAENPHEKRGRYRAPIPPPAPPQPEFVNAPKTKSFRFRTWEFLQELKSDEVLYGLKMASALTFVGLWTWLGWAFGLMAADKGQWVMTTILAVLSPTIGATFSICAWRVGGTLVGITWAMLTYLAYPNNPYVILAMMIFITFTVTYCILVSTYPTMGVIMILSYNSIVFGIYHGRTQDNIFVTCYKVAITMTIGILISVVLNTFLWPVLARRELRKEIALLIGRQGVLFAELVNRYLLEESTSRERISQVRHADISDEKARTYANQTSDEQEDNKQGEADEKSSDMDGGDRSSMGSKLVTGSGRNVPRRHVDDSSLRQDERNHHSEEVISGEDDRQEDYHWDADQLAFQHVEHQLQTKLIKISQLLELSASEPRLKEEFPRKLYTQIVQCCQNILDRLVSMRMAAQLLSTEVRDLVTGPMNYYRRDMVGALLLYFSVLSSSLASKTALPPYLPSARMARLRVIYNVRQAIAAHQAETGEDHYTYIYYYAFSSALEEVIEELELLAILIKPLVGVTLVGSGGGYPCGIAADQLSLASAIPPIHTPIPPLQPGGAVILADDGSDLRLGLGTGIMQAPGPTSELLDMPNGASEQARLEQELQSQWVELQRQQLQGVHPDLVLPAAAEDLSPGGETTTPKNTRATNSVASPQQQQPRQHRRRAVGLEEPVISTQPFNFAGTYSMSSPGVVMDQTLLDNRHAQRFKEAMETANEVGSLESTSVPASIATPVARSTSFRKMLSDRIKDSPLIKEVLSPGGHHQQAVGDNSKLSSPPQITPEHSSLGLESKETTIDPAGEKKDVAASPRHGLGLVLHDTSLLPHPGDPPSNEEERSEDPK